MARHGSISSIVLRTQRKLRRLDDVLALANSCLHACLAALYMFGTYLLFAAVFVQSCDVLCLQADARRHINVLLFNVLESYRKRQTQEKNREK